MSAESLTEMVLKELRVYDPELSEGGTRYGLVTLYEEWLECNPIYGLAGFIGEGLHGIEGVDPVPEELMSQITPLLDSLEWIEGSEKAREMILSRVEPAAVVRAAYGEC